MSRRLTTILILSAMLLTSTAAFAQDQYPPSGYDVVSTSATVSLYDPGDPNLLLETMVLTGNAVIWRSDPYDPGDGRLTIDTRMDTLLLRGFSLTYGDSTFVTLNRDWDPANGLIRQVTAHIDFPAESFFDLYFKMTIGSEPANPSPPQDPDGGIFQGRLGYDMQNKTGSLVVNAAGDVMASKAAPFAAKLPVGVPAQEGADKDSRVGGDVIGSATYIPSLPYGDGGNTCQYVNDYDEVCPYSGSTAPDVVYAYDPPIDTFITISTCNMAGSYDTKIYVYRDGYTPGAPVACNDDACADYTSVIECMPVLANATYYIVIDGYGAECGEYELTVDFATSCTPCDFDCPANAYIEKEPCGADDNGGCNSTPNQFEDITCGMDVCGTAWSDSTIRDTDWYKFTLASEMVISMTGSAKFPYLMGFVDTSDCDLAGSVDPYAISTPCDTQTVSRIAGPGTYFAFFATQSFAPVPCGESNDYFFQLRCAPTGFNSDSTHMCDTIWQIPPVGRVYKDPRKVPVRDAAGNIIGYTWHEHRVDPPEGGIDTIPTIGIMPIWVGPEQPSPTQPPTETVELTGQAIISRGDPYLGELGPEIQTKILSMNMDGESEQFGQMFLSLPSPAPGMVTSLDPDPDGEFFPARSYFDVNYQVEMPREGLMIEPVTPPRMQTTVEALPPVNNQYTTKGELHPVWDVQNPEVILGWTRPIHWVAPPPTPTGACCEEQTGVCFIMTEAECKEFGGTYQGDGTQCEPNPCEEPCETGWTPGVDTITYSSFEIDVFDPSDSTIYLGTAYAFGVNMIVQRNAPYEVSPGIWRMDTNILQFSGNGSSPLMGGPFTIGLNPQFVSNGWIQMCDSCNDTWAESHWSIYYEISTTQPYPRDVLRGSALMDLPCSAGWNPFSGDVFGPPNGHSYNDPRKVPIYDANGNIIGYTMKRHRVDNEELGACCNLAAGTCRITTVTNCDPPSETWQGPGTACYPNPCTCTDWTPGIDTIPFSAFEVELFDPSDSTVSLGTLTAFGSSMIVQRGAPYEVSPGIWRMDTDILAFGGGGTSILVGGLFTLELDPGLASGGWIQMCDSCEDNWAESFWDLNYRILTSLPAPRNIMKGNAQMRLPCDRKWNPFPGGGPFTPPTGDSYVDPRKVPIYDADGNLIGYTMKIHRIDVEPFGACCEQGTGLCFIMTASECEEAQGSYFGDGTVCDPNPCDTCETGWTPGVDTITYSSFEIDVFDPSDSTIYLGTAYAFGVNMIVQRNAPYEVSPGIWRMDTDILQFSGNGNSPLMGGPFTIGLNPQFVSNGWIQMCDSCNDTWAESHWSIYYEISTTQPYPRDLLRGSALMDLPCSAGWNPFSGDVFGPPNGHSYNDPRKVPIYDANGNIIGYTMKRHHVADDELGACCNVAAGTCRMTTVTNCDPPSETWHGPGTACYPNPCTCTDWTPGIDTIPFSAFEVELFDPSDSTVSLGTLTAFGSSMIVQRGAPYEVSPGIWRMDTDILAFGGGGTSILVGGLFTLELDPGLASGGWIQMCDSCEDNWAESFWDLNYRILTSLPAPRNIMKGNAQMRLPCDRKWNPFPGGGPFTPPTGDSYVDPRKVPIYDADGNLIGYTMKIHRIDVEPFGACCEQGTGLCFIMTASECEEAQGSYFGDGTVCDPNPCDTCETGWTPGVDTILYSAFDVEMYDPSDSTASLGTLTAFGVNMVVQRGAPFEESPGIWRMNTTIVEFGGGGTSALVGGAFTLQLDPSLASTGFIRMCDSCDDTWAESHFTVNYEILTTQPFPDNALNGSAEMHLPCGRQWDPFPGGVFTPPNGNSYVDPRKVPIYDASGQIIGYSVKQHRVDRDPMGACCDPFTGACAHMTAQDCEEIGGIYLGDNVACSADLCAQPCTTGWTPGVDTIPTHDFEIELYDNTGTVLVTTLTATGIEMIVQRGAPFEVSPGVFRMNTTIVQFDGSGTDPVLGGPFEIRLAPTPPSTGYIQMCDSCDDNWAESFFTVHWILTTTLGPPMNVLTGDPAQMHLACSGNWDPFAGGAFLPPYDIPYNDPRIVPIYNAAGEIIGYTRKRHTPRPDTVCCIGPIRGDVNFDGAVLIDISDLVYLIDYMFTGGPAPECWSETNIDCSDSPPPGDGPEDIDISDLVYLIDYMFREGPRPCPCDCVPNEECWPPPAKSGSSKLGDEVIRKWSTHVSPMTTPTSSRTGATR